MNIDCTDNQPDYTDINFEQIGYLWFLPAVLFQYRATHCIIKLSLLWFF